MRSAWHSGEQCFHLSPLCWWWISWHVWQSYYCHSTGHKQSAHLPGHIHLHEQESKTQRQLIHNTHYVYKDIECVGGKTQQICCMCKSSISPFYLSINTLKICIFAVYDSQDFGICAFCYQGVWIRKYVVVVPSLKNHVQNCLLKLVFYQEVSIKESLENLDHHVISTGSCQKNWWCGSFSKIK